MAADEDDTESAGNSAAGSGDAKSAGERRQRDRRQRPPVTIDLTAKDVPARPASPAPGSKPPPPESAAKSESAAKPQAASASEAPRSAQAERPQADRSQAAQSAAGAQAPRRPRPFAAMDDAWTRSAAAGVAGGIVALILVIVMQAIGILPAPGRSAANEAAEQARTAAAATSALERRQTAIEAMVEGLPAMRTEIGTLGSEIAALESARATLATQADVEAVVSAIGALRQRIDAIPPPAVSRDEVDTLVERIGRLEVAVAAGGGNSPASDAALASLASQLGEAETGLRSLSERIAAAEAKMSSLGTASPMAGGDAAVKAIAITALRRAAEGGEPFATEVDMVAALGIAGDDVAKLRPIADRGVPANAIIVADFPAVADAILAATASGDPNAGFFQRVVSGIGGLVSIRPAGPIAGSDPPAIVSRMTAAVDKGDLAAALAEREGLAQSGKDASAEWAASTADRVALDELVERIARSLDSRTAG